VAIGRTQRSSGTPVVGGTGLRAGHAEGRQGEHKVRALQRRWCTLDLPELSRTRFAPITSTTARDREAGSTAMVPLCGNLSQGRGSTHPLSPSSNLGKGATNVGANLVFARPFLERGVWVRILELAVNDSPHLPPESGNRANLVFAPITSTTARDREAGSTSMVPLCGNLSQGRGSTHSGVRPHSMPSAKWGQTLGSAPTGTVHPATVIIFGNPYNQC